MYNIRDVYSAFDAVGQETVNLSVENVHSITVDEIASTCDGVSVDDVISALNAIVAAAPRVELRAKRDAMLAQCDWIVTKSLEAGQPTPSEWQTYRQALRDITNTYTSLDNVVWPTKP
jgi:hypothetical protein